MNNPRVLAVITVLIWSTGQTLGKILSSATAFSLFALSTAFALVTFTFYALATEGKGWIIRLRNIDRKFILFGLLGYFFYWLGVSECYRSYATVSEPGVLNYTWPLFTALFTELFFRTHKHVKSKAVYLVEGTGILLGFLSTLLMVTEGHILSFNITNGRGLAWGLFAGASYGLYSAFSSTVEKDKQLTFLITSAGLGVIGLGLLSVFQASSLSGLTIPRLLAVVALGCVVDGFGYIVWTRTNRGARELGVSIASITSIVYVLPVLSLIVLSISFRESRILQPYFILVLVLLVSGSFLCQQGASMVAKRVGTGVS